MEVSKRTTTRIGHLSPLTKNKKKKTKKIPPYDRKFVVQQYFISLKVHYDSKPVTFVA